MPNPQLGDNSSVISMGLMMTVYILYLGGLSILQNVIKFYRLVSLISVLSLEFFANFLVILVDIIKILRSLIFITKIPAHLIQRKSYLSHLFCQLKLSPT